MKELRKIYISRYNNLKMPPGLNLKLIDSFANNQDCMSFQIMNEWNKKMEIEIFPVESIPENKYHFKQKNSIQKISENRTVE